MESFPLFEGPAFYLGDGVLAHFAAQFVNDLFALCQKLLATGLDDAVALFVSLVLQFCFDLLDDNPLLARSVQRRYPYLLPLNVIQVEMMRRYRKGDQSEQVSRNIQLTMNGLSTALRNSG